MSDLDQARQMLDLAGNDLTALENMADSRVFTEGIFGFHAQQAIEKSLKAWLSFKGVLYPKTHNLRLLLQMLKENGESIERFRDLREYEVYAVQFRYEALEPAEQPLDREQTIQKVTVLFRHVESMLK